MAITPDAVKRLAQLWDVAGHGPHKGVLLVHGGGPQDQSNTLLTCGGPLIDWLRTFWASARGPRVAGAPVLPEVGETVLDFSPLDDGDNGGFSRASVFLPNSQRWTLAEAWWAKSVLPPSTLEVFPGFLARLSALLVRVVNAWPRWKWLNQYLVPDQRRFNGWDLVIDLAAWFIKVEVILAQVAEVPFLFVLAVLSEIHPLLNGFILANAAQEILKDGVGEIKLYQEDEIQAANLRRRVADVVTHLAMAGCTDITIVAHSLGAVVSYDMLSDPAYCRVQRHVSKFITLSEGLNWFWMSEKPLQRLRRPIAPNVYWVDIWASYDTAPAGPLQPPLLEVEALEQDRWKGERQWQNNRLRRQSDNPPRQPPPGGQRVAIYNPNDEVRREQGLRLRLEDVVPAEVEVMNELDPFDDHNRYFRNDEEVLPLLAAEIDATNHGDSTYWRGTTNGGMEEVKKRRKQRLAHLGLIRLIWGAGQAGIVLVAIAQVLRGDPIFPVRWLPGVGPAVESTLDCLIISAIWWLLTVVVRLVRAPAGQGPQGRPSGYVGLGGLIWGTGQVAILLIALAQLLGPLATVLPKVDCLIPSFLQLPWFSNKDVLAIIWAWILYSLAWAVPYTAARMYWQWRDRIGRREAISLIARGYRRPQPGLGAVRPA